MTDKTARHSENGPALEKRPGIETQNGPALEGSCYNGRLGQWDPLPRDVKFVHEDESVGILDLHWFKFTDILDLHESIWT